MHAFYKKALAWLACLILASLAAAAACVNGSRLHAALLPAGASALPWRLGAESDAPQGGQSSMQADATGGRLRLRLQVLKTVEHPFAAASLSFRGPDGSRAHVDLSAYRAISFRVRCAPANTLALHLPTFDPEVSTRHHLLTYRTPSAFFSCGENWASVELDLTRLETPQWWFDMSRQDVARSDYRLDQVPRLVFSSSFQSPAGVPALVEIEDLALEGRDQRYLFLLGALLLLGWAGYGFWFFRAHAYALVEEVRGRLQQDLAIVAYQQLSVEPHRDREKAAVLRLIATSYAQADLDLETVVARTGVNRNKVDEILKAELGFTFSGYLNKLRLTEAARLLAENGSASVAEIACAVGYGNVSCFNQLFKEEYGRTPKAFRSACASCEELA